MKKMLSILLSGAMLCAALAMPVAAENVGANTVDTWAVKLVTKAVDSKLLPQHLEGKDLRENITRAEFAALTVKLYEAMSRQEAMVPKQNPFKDTEDPEVLKAYGLHIVSGITPNTFAPDDLVTREQAAKMLSAVYQAQSEINKKAYLLWIIAQGNTDDKLNTDLDLTQQQSNNILSGIYNQINGKLDTHGATPFADHSKIADWARDSVYFMEKNGIVNGVGNNCFAPKDNAQAQAALIMAVQMLNKL